MSLSGFNFKQAFGREKPHSSVTDWVEIMTAPQMPEESLEGMPELVDAINLQASGPQEAARAIRKKMKHGDAHHQYRAIVIMRLLVENVPEKMTSAFTDSQFTLTIQAVMHDPFVNKRVKKRLVTVLQTWEVQYKENPSMAVFASMHERFKKDKRLFNDDNLVHLIGHPDDARPKHRKDKKEGERGHKKAHSHGGERRRRSFDFDRDREKVTMSIVDASQASSNLLNAITRANLETGTLEGNEEVQTWLGKAKTAKKSITRYTQLVENDELIGTLIETHERLEDAIQTYNGITGTDDTTGVTSQMAAATLAGNIGSQGDNDAASQQERSVDAAYENPAAPRATNTNNHSNNPFGALHPDLADLDFHGSAKNLPPPIRPTSAPGNRTREGAFDEDKRASLSDYSDYESSGEETAVKTAKKKRYVTVSDDSGDEDVNAAGPSQQTISKQPAAPVNGDDDPFAD